jgi:hypothetical protein
MYDSYPQQERVEQSSFNTLLRMQQFKIYELSISGKFHLIFADHSWRQVTETLESETVGGLGETIVL